MPELPEVEAARRLVERHCTGKTITGVLVQPDNKVFETIADTQQINQSLLHWRITSVYRYGKYMWWQLDSGQTQPLFHFGMTGAILVEGVESATYRGVNADSSEWPPKSWKLRVEFEDGTRMAFVDARRLGRFHLVADAKTSEHIKVLGFDPYLNLPSVAQLADLLKSRGGKRIKPLLLDQAFSAGVGNWVADEVLYNARIHPEELVKELSPEQIAGLHQALHHVVTTAVSVGADSSKYPDHWLFHQRWNQKSNPTLLGNKIEFSKTGGRTSAFVPALQKLKTPIVSAVEPDETEAVGEPGANEIVQAGQQADVQQMIWSTQPMNDQHAQQKTTTPKKRGRPPGSKSAKQGLAPAQPPRKRGRPPKKLQMGATPEEQPQKRGRGRPKKLAVQGQQAAQMSPGRRQSQVQKRPRGRPKKVAGGDIDPYGLLVEDPKPQKPTRGRGRPRKTAVQQPAVGADGTPIKRRRGRPPKHPKPAVEDQQPPQPGPEAGAGMIFFHQ